MRLCPPWWRSAWSKVNAKLGTNYQLFNYYGAPDADRVIVAMGSICDVAEEVIDYLNAHGEKVGLVKVRLYPPLRSREADRGYPRHLQEDRRSGPHQGARRSGRAPVSWMWSPLWPTPARTTLPSSAAVTVWAARIRLLPPCSLCTTELAKAEMKRQFTIGIVDDVTNMSLPEDPNCPNTAAEGTIECKFWGLGGDGTVGANKNSIKIIGDHTDKYVQAYFQYDSKKTGGVTISHLRFGDKPIRSPYYINKADFVACHNPSLRDQGLQDGAGRQARRRLHDQLPVGLR